MTTKLIFRKWELSHALLILREAAQWLIDRWDPSWSLLEFEESSFLARYDINNIVVWYHSDIPVCTCVLPWHDPDFWSHVPLWKSWFLHKVAIRRSYAWQWYIRQLLDFAILESQTRNISVLRLDVDPKRPKLCRYYESLWFSYLDSIDCIWYRVNRYELYF